MDNIYITFFVVVPIGMFLGGFLIARQMRTLQNAPFIAMMFVQRRWFLSAVTGLLVSGFFSLILLSETNFSFGVILIFVAVFLIASASYYFGITVGWGRFLPASEGVAPPDQPRTRALPDHAISPAQPQESALPENIILDETLDSVKITINTQKRWVWFGLELFNWVMIGLCALPILGLMAIAALQDYLPGAAHIFVWIAVSGLVFCLLYIKFEQALEYVFDQEIIEVSNLSITIEKSGWIFKSKREYPADNIQRITTMFSLGGANTVLTRSPFVNQNMPAFMLWHRRGLKRHRPFGRAVDFADTQRILNAIYIKFPHYRG